MGMGKEAPAAAPIPQLATAKPATTTAKPATATAKPVEPTAKPAARARPQNDNSEDNAQRVAAAAAEKQMATNAQVEPAQWSTAAEPNASPLGSVRYCS